MQYERVPYATRQRTAELRTTSMYWMRLGRGLPSYGTAGDCRATSIPFFALKHFDELLFVGCDHAGAAVNGVFADLK